MIRKVFNRLRSDYLIRNRIGEYDALLASAIQNEYKIVSISSFRNLVLANSLGEDRYLLIRHDIDSDPLYSSDWLEIEKKWGAYSSYYFRLSTAHVQMMQEIKAYGADCGYHYEEIATFAKKNKISSPAKIIECIPEIRAIFRANLANLEKSCSFKMESIASHGDFANRILGISNHRMIDQEFLASVGVHFEVYQEDLVRNYSVNISDCGYPKLYKGSLSVQEAMDQKLKVIHLLVHPKHWRSNWSWNTSQNVSRLVEGVRYKFAT
jgi:hypothetical protein